MYKGQCNEYIEGNRRNGCDDKAPLKSSLEIMQHDQCDSRNKSQKREKNMFSSFTVAANKACRSCTHRWRTCQELTHILRSNETHPSFKRVLVMSSHRLVFHLIQRENKRKEKKTEWWMEALVRGTQPGYLDKSCCQLTSNQVHMMSFAAEEMIPIAMVRPPFLSLVGQAKHLIPN